MSTIDDALRDCQMAVKGRIAHVPTDEAVLQTFVEKFRRDFDATSESEPDAWTRDKQRVTTLARASATFSGFAALTDIAVPRRVTYVHLSSPTRYCPPSAARKESRCDGSSAQPRNPDLGDLP
jgi:hypothetical protein